MCFFCFSVSSFSYLCLRSDYIFLMYRILVMLWGFSARFWDMIRFINQSLVSYFQAQPDYTCWKDSRRKFC